MSVDAARFERRFVSMKITTKAVAEFFGTFWLVLLGAGSAVLAAAYPEVGIGFLGVAIAFGLALLTAAYAIGRISGCHVNPAVSLGLWVGGRFKTADLLPYIVAQVAGRRGGRGRSLRRRERQGRIRRRQRLRRQRLRRPLAGRLLARSSTSDRGGNDRRLHICDPRGHFVPAFRPGSPQSPSA